MSTVRIANPVSLPQMQGPVADTKHNNKLFVIPKILTLVWFGSTQRFSGARAKSYYSNLKRWRDLNPEYDIQVFSDSS